MGIMEKKMETTSVGLGFMSYSPNFLRGSYAGDCRGVL